MKKKPNISDCKIVNLETTDCGNGIVTNFNHFDLKRVYYLYDVPSGISRGSHAHKNSSQLIVAASGSFKIILKDGDSDETFLLDRPDMGLHVVPNIWRELIEFTEGTVCLVLSPETYDEDGCIRNYEDYVKSTKEQ